MGATLSQRVPCILIASYGGHNGRKRCNQVLFVYDKKLNDYRTGTKKQKPIHTTPSPHPQFTNPFVQRGNALFVKDVQVESKERDLMSRECKCANSRALRLCPLSFA
jgi:hypothetical protein